MSWLWRWLVEFWAGSVCGYSGLSFILYFVEDFEFFFLDLEFVGRSGNCGYSLWRLICRWWWFSNRFVVGIWLCLFSVVFWVVEEALSCGSGYSGGCWFLVGGNCH